uniref:Retinal rod rhodopsin-sensitive cGMP 3',5'-cyclic phosphodiesterase subunit gamma n=1 Tax=Canis lupus familiaris TaxID=9615 RepID=A0A8I3RXL9_CANLF
MNLEPPKAEIRSATRVIGGPVTPRKGPPKFKQRQTRQFKSKPPKKGVQGFGDDIPGMEGLGTGMTASRVFPDPPTLPRAVGLGPCAPCAVSSRSLPRASPQACLSSAPTPSFSLTEGLLLSVGSPGTWRCRRAPRGPRCPLTSLACCTRTLPSTPWEEDLWAWTTGPRPP